ncbi:hypothetical protein HDV63DRAFT_198592 [Trichoderma sp. SZMC 28014]
MAVPSGSAAHQASASLCSSSQLLAATVQPPPALLEPGTVSGRLIGPCPPTSPQYQSTSIPKLPRAAATVCTVQASRRPFLCCRSAVQCRDPIRPPPANNVAGHPLGGEPCWRRANPESLRIGLWLQLPRQTSVKWPRPVVSASQRRFHAFACRRACAALGGSYKCTALQAAEREGPWALLLHHAWIWDVLYEVRAVFPRTRPSFDSASRLPRSGQRLAALYYTCPWRGAETPALAQVKVLQGE